MPFSAKDFPSSTELQRVAQEHEFFQFYSSDTLDPLGETDRAKFRLKQFFESDQKKAQILDTALNLAPIVVDAGTDFTFGKYPKIELDDDAENREAVQDKIDEIVTRNNLLQKFSDSTTLFQVAGHTHFKLYAQGNQAFIDEVPFSYWFPNYDGVPVGRDSTNPRIVVYLNTFEDGVEAKYIYVEDYYLDPARQNKLTIAKSLWKDSGAKLGDQVDLNKFPSLVSTDLKAEKDGSKTMLQETQLDFIPIVSVDVRRNPMIRQGESVLKKVKPLLFAINDRLTQIETQFLKHLNAKLQIPYEAAPRKKDGSVDVTKLEVLLAKKGEDAKYITNDNPLIEAAFDHLESLIRKVAKLTQTPDSFLTEDEKGGVEKAESLRTRLLWFISRIERYQRIYETCIRSVIVMALKIEGEKEADKLPITVTFPSSLPKDWQHDVEVWGSAKSMGLASKETAIGRFQDIEGDELEEELKRIEEDEQAQQESMLKMIDAEGADDPPEEE